jgi:hypothetical protein
VSADEAVVKALAQILEFLFWAAFAAAGLAILFIAGRLAWWVLT